MDVRPIHTIAREIHADWRKQKSGIYFGAVPYIQAMACVESVDDVYGCEDGRTQVIYFLSNASTWRGETARRIKKELKSIIG